MEKTYKYCQSCGIPLKKDSKGGGTHADGSKSKMYCSLCYIDGQFTQPNFTATQMQKFAKSKLKEKGMPGFVAGFFTKGIPNLERWNETE